MERKDYIATIQELLKGRNEEFDKADVERIRLIRHKDSRKEKIIGGKIYENSLYDIYLYDNDAFMTYQSEQLVKKFKNVDYIVSFIGEESTSSRFVGVYKNNGILQMLPDYKGESLARFDIQEISGFELLKERVIIDWNNPVQWLQHYNAMPVIRIDRGLMENNLPVFVRYEDVMLNYTQLKTIINSNNPEWKSRLESCNCIYLILDKSNGKQYVGSTYNTKGIWGRWSEYAKTGHGNDVELKKCIDSDPKYAEKNFQWCILETLPIKILQDQAIERESLYKRKLGTRIYGYSKN
ncbi:MAG: GIY-YIG nuclease family protein [Alloprevotella sp.]|nr:GIY-YIG nuclease family protein [Alloprevotella sp.]